MSTDLFEDNGPLSLPPELRRMAYDNFGETPETRTKALSDLRDRIQSLPEQDRIEDQSDLNLIRFIRGRKYNLDKALQTTVEMRRFNAAHPDWVNLTPSDLEQFAPFNPFLRVFGPDSRGRKVLIMFPAKGIKIFTDEFVKANPLAMIKFNIWMFDRISRDLHVQVNGLIVCNTFQNFSLVDSLAMSKMAPMSHQTATFAFFSKCAAIRLAGAFIMEAPMIMRAIWSLARYFVSEKMRARVSFCGKDFEALHLLVGDPSVLPECLGGTQSEDTHDWVLEQAQLHGNEMTPTGGGGNKDSRGNRI